MAEPVKKAQAGIAPSVFGGFPRRQLSFEFTPEGEADLGWDPASVQRAPFEAYGTPPAETHSPLVEARKGIKEAVPPAMKESLRQKLETYRQARGLSEGPPIIAGRPGRVAGPRLEELPEDIRPRMVAGKPVYFRPDYAERVGELDLTDEQKQQLLAEQRSFAQTPRGMETDILRREGRGLEERTQAQMQAGEAAAWGDQAIADAIDQGILDVRDIEDQKQIFQQEWSQKRLEKMNAYQTAIEKLESGEIDPQRRWKGTGGWGRGVAIAAAFIFGQRQLPLIMDMLNKETERDIQAQIENRKTKLLGLQARKGLLNEIGKYVQDEVAQKEAAQAFVLKQLDHYVVGLQSRTASAVKKARLAELDAALRTEIDTREKKIELANTLSAQKEAWEAAKARLNATAANRKALEKQLEGYEFNPLAGKFVPSNMSKELTQKMQYLDTIDSALAALKEIGPTAVVYGTAENQRAKMLSAQIAFALKEIYDLGAHDKSMQEAAVNFQAYDPTSVFQRLWGDPNVVDELRASLARERELTKVATPGVSGVQLTSPEGQVVKTPFPTGPEQARERAETGLESTTGVSPGAVRKFEGKPK